MTSKPNASAANSAAGLFSVFDDDRESSSSSDEEVAPPKVAAAPASTSSSKPSKRRASSPLTRDNRAPLAHDGSSPLAHDIKQASRLPPAAVAAPIVLDSFETSAEKEFAPALVDAETGSKVVHADGEGVEPKKVVLVHQIRHQVAIPPGYPYIPIAEHEPPAKPARTYPFTLDPFQKVSVNCIDRNESVLVAAHTSAGKTVVAEYAIATALRDKQRVIYTSPIKVGMPWYLAHVCCCEGATTIVATWASATTFTAFMRLK